MCRITHLLVDRK
jgi:hypothetical protein